jgi:hypothetical protein
MRLSPRTWGKLTLGVLIIGGVLVTLWATNRPAAPTPVQVTPTPTPAPLHAARARLVVTGAGPARRATLRCDGARRDATGFWAGAAKPGCDALSSVHVALLAGPGCTAPVAGRVRLRASGSIAGRRFDHLAQRGGCPGDQQWLEVDALVAPVIRPDQKLDRASG